MKKLAGLVIILVALIMVSYYGMGIVTEKTIKRNIEIINQSNGLSGELENYQRHFFCSTAFIKWKLHVPERAVKDANGQTQVIAAQDYQMDMPVKIYHGPIILADHTLHFGMGFAESVIPFPEKYNEQFNASFASSSTKPQMNLSIFVNYLNKSAVNLSVPEFKLVFKEGNGQFEWKGMQSSTDISSSIQKVAGNFVINGLLVSKNDSKLILDKVTTEYNLHETPNGIYLGSANFALPSLQVKVKDQKTFEVDDLALNSDSDIDNNLFSTHFNASLSNLFINNKNYGPATLEISLRNLDAEVLAKINQQANAMQNGTEAERQQAILTLLPQLPKLFAKGAEFEISQLKVKLPQGDLEGSLMLALPKGESTNPFDILQKLHGTAKLSVPVAVVKSVMQQSIMMQQANAEPAAEAAASEPAVTAGTEQPAQPVATANNEQMAALQTDKQLASLEQAGIIKVQGTNYEVELSLEQGKLMVNGKPFDPAMLKF